MSSLYPPYSNMPTQPCQQCKTPLSPNEIYCKSCGYYNTPAQKSSPAEGVPSAGMSWGGPQPGGTPWNQSPPQVPPAPAYPAYGQTKSQTFGSSPYGQAGPQTFAAPPRQQSYGVSSTGQPRQQSYGVPFTGQPGQQPYGGSPFAPVQPGMPMPDLPQTPVFKGRLRAPRRGPTPGMIAVVVVLVLIVLIGGGTASYIFMKKGNSSSSQISSTPLATTTYQFKGTPLFTETFKDNAKKWSIQSYPKQFSVAIDGGALLVEDDHNELLWEPMPGGKTFADFTLVMDMELSKGDPNNGYGISFRGSSDQNGILTTYYRFELYGDGSYGVFKGAVDANGNASSTKLVDDNTLHPTIQTQGKSNHVIITARGTSLLFSVNGQTLKTITDSSYANGSIAFFVSNIQNAKPGAQAKFSNLIIYPAQG